MLVRPGHRACVYFNVSIAGVDASLANVAAYVRRNEILTTVLVDVNELATGLYRCLFDIPDHWQGHDQVYVTFTVHHLGENISCTKPVGTIAAAGLDDDTEYNMDRVLDLLEADETYDKRTGVARKLLRGTNTVLLEKTVDGSSCVESVSITE